MLSPDQLRALRTRLRWDQAETADILHVSRRQYQRYETGTPLPYAVGALFVLVASAVITRAQTIAADARRVAEASGYTHNGDDMTLGAALLVYPVDLKAFPLVAPLPFELGELADRLLAFQDF